MTEQAAPAGSAPATPVHYDGWDEKGNPIVTSEIKPKEQESAPAAAPEETAVSEPEKAKGQSESEPDKHSQEPKGSEAEKRIKELVAKEKAARERAELAERERDDLRRSRADKTEKAESSPAPPPATYEAWRKTHDPDKWMADYQSAHPDAKYEQVRVAEEEFRLEKRDQFRELQRQVAESARVVNERMAEARKRYEGYDEKIKPLQDVLAKELNAGRISNVMAFIGESTYGADLLFVLAGDPDMTAKLNAMPAVKAISKLRDMERDIEQALAKGKEETKADPKETPAEPKPRAPKPVSEVGGRSALPEDPRVTAARSGKFSDFEAEENRRHFAARS